MQNTNNIEILSKYKGEDIMYEKTYKVSAKRVSDVEVDVEARGHKIKIDEPVAQGGTDKGMNPVEMLLGSVAACQTITASIYAESMGIKIDEDLAVSRQSNRIFLLFLPAAAQSGRMIFLFLPMARKNHERARDEIFGPSAQI